MKKLCMIFFSLLLVFVIIEMVYTESSNTTNVPAAEKHFAFGVNLGWGMVDGMASGMGMKDEEEWLRWALRKMSRKHINTLHIGSLLPHRPESDQNWELPLLKELACTSSNNSDTRPDLLSDGFALSL